MSDARETIAYVEGSEPAPAHEVSEEVKAAILAKHGDGQNRELEQHKRALEFISEHTNMVSNLGAYIAEGILSSTLVAARFRSVWQESFSEAIANRMDKTNDK